MSTVQPTKSHNDLSEDDEYHPYRAVPLSTRKIFGIISFLALYSFLYLIYAQHHRILFYIMTGLIASWICFIYTAGILSVLYMVVIDYEVIMKEDDERWEVDQLEKKNREQQESTM